MKRIIMRVLSVRIEIVNPTRPVPNFRNVLFCSESLRRSIIRELQRRIIRSSKRAFREAVQLDLRKTRRGHGASARGVEARGGARARATTVGLVRRS